MEYSIEKFVNKDINVFLEDFDLPDHEHWFRLADAYISCSLHLLYSMVEESLESNFFRAKACVFLFEHSVELFLKFSLSAAKKQINSNHKLQNFYNQYCSLYPEEIFKFKSDIENVVREKPLYPHNTFPKYPGDKDGNLWSKNVYIDLIALLKNVKLAKEDFHRLKSLIIEKYSNQ